MSDEKNHMGTLTPESCGERVSDSGQSAGWVENGCSLPVGDDCPVTGIPCDECGFGQPNDTGEPEGASK